MKTPGAAPRVPAIDRDYYYRIDGNGVVTYLFENRNGFPADVAFAVGDLNKVAVITGGNSGIGDRQGIQPA